MGYRLQRSQVEANTRAMLSGRRVNNVLLYGDSGTGKSASAFLEKIGIPEDKLHIAARINDQEAIKNLVAGGLGVSIVSEKAVHDYIDAKRLLQFELPGHIAGREFYIIYHKDFILKDYVCEFIKYLEHCYKQ